MRLPCMFHIALPVLPVLGGSRGKGRGQESVPTRRQTRSSTTLRQAPDGGRLRQRRRPGEEQEAGGDGDE